jgi:hypothetical protein
MTRNRIVACMVSVASFMSVAGAAPAVSDAAFEIIPGSFEADALDSVGQPDTRAGGHPDRIVTHFELNPENDGTAARDLGIEFEPGLTGTPSATPRCPRTLFDFEKCPKNTMVGKFIVQIVGLPITLSPPIYNLVPGEDQVAQLGVNLIAPTVLEMRLRPTDYGLSISTENLIQVPLESGDIELWGIPADHNGALPSARAAFLTVPTKCGSLEAVLRMRSWLPAAPQLTETAELDPFTGCEGLPFEPQLDLQLENPTTDLPTGAEVDLSLAEHEEPDELVSSGLKDVTIDLPPGLVVSPGGVEGRELCSDAQLGLGTESTVTCPVRSRVGSITVSTPQLSEPLAGPVFLGEEQPGERFRLFVDATGHGIQYKAVGKLIANPTTGQLSTVLSDLPQFSVGHISLDFDGGPQSLLATPIGCGPVTAHARFVPYSGAETVESSSVVDFASRTGSCPSPPAFSPGLMAGSTDTGAGSSTHFSLTLSRHDGEQLPGRFSTTLPPGLSAHLNAVDLCTDSDAAAARCQASSQIGSAVAEVGSGATPAKVGGAVYLTEAYKNAPYGLAIVFRAAIGPFDLGSIVVRGTLRIDPRTGQVTIEHSLPTIFEGVPLRFQTIGIDLNRPGFLVNPTSCEPEELISTVYSVDGRAAPVTDPFQVTGCSALGFRPRLSLSLNHKGRRNAAHPKLSISVKMRDGDANLRRFKVQFPGLLTFHSGGVQAICARGEASEGSCPAGSQVGTAVARSRLLNEPLRGPVYLVQPKGGGFPDLWSNVKGQGVQLQLISESLRGHGSLSTETIELPDTPLSAFSLNLDGGKGGIFSLRSNPCKAQAHRLTSPVALEAQDDAYRAMRVSLDAGCSNAGRSKRTPPGRTSSRDR